MRKTDFIVVGAPKCGTTALHAYLGESPHVFVLPKELHHFGRDLQFSLPTTDREEYQRHLEESDGRLIGEVEVWYLFSETAAEEIAEYNPDMKIVIMLRNPVDFMYSMHSQAVFSNEEPVESFESALALENDRRAGRHRPPLSYVEHAVYYRSLATFSEQIARYQRHFPEDRIHYILLDDMAQSPEGVWLDLTDFLEIPDRPAPTFNVVNPNKRQRIRALGRADALIRRSVVPRLHIDSLPATIKRRGKSFLRLVERVNTRHVDRPPMPSDLRSHLLAEFENEIQSLEDILRRDLDGWRN